MLQSKNRVMKVQMTDAYPLAFSELLISETKKACADKFPPSFRLADLTNMYNERLIQLGVEALNTHKSRLKEQLLACMPELESFLKGREVLLAFAKK